MKYGAIPGWVLVLFLFLSQAAHGQVEEIVEGEVFITFREGVTRDERDVVLKKFGLKPIKNYELFGFGLYQTDQNTLEVIEKLKKESPVS